MRIAIVGPASSGSSCRLPIRFVVEIFDRRAMLQVSLSPSAILSPASRSCWPAGRATWITGLSS
jgi:hypothetical protein